MYNVSEVIIRNIDLKKDKKLKLEYDYKPNFSSAVTNIRLYLRKKINMKELILRIKKFWSLKDQKDRLNVIYKVNHVSH